MINKNINSNKLYKNRHIFPISIFKLFWLLFEL